MVERLKLLLLSENTYKYSKNKYIKIKQKGRGGQVVERNGREEGVDRCSLLKSV
jgi:hypothetical protein